MDRENIERPLRGPGALGSGTSHTRYIALLLVVTLIFAAVAAGCSRAGVGKADVQSARESLQTTLDAISSGDEGTTAYLMGAIGFSPEDYGVGMDRFADSYLAGMSTEIGEAVPRDDGTVAFPVTLSVHTQEELLAALDASRSAASASDGQVRAGAVDGDFPSFLSEAQPTSVLTSMTVVMEKDGDGTWTLHDPATLAAVLLGGYDPRQAES